MENSLACSNLPLVREFAAGELPDADVERFETHVLTCSICAEALNAIQSNDPFTREVRIASTVPTLEDQSMTTFIDQLVRTPPDLARPVFKLPAESIATSRLGRLQAAEAKRQILVARARDEERLRREARLTGTDSKESAVAPSEALDRVLALDEALTRLQALEEDAARLVLLHYFARLTLDEAADILRITPPSAQRLWAFAKAWLHREMQGGYQPI
jgi:hypothetical protein